MYSWLNVRPTVLDDIVGLDGPGDSELDLCASCSRRQPIPLYRCLECSYSLLYCNECIVRKHGELPLHRLEVCISFSCDNVALTAPLVLAKRIL